MKWGLITAGTGFAVKATTATGCQTAKTGWNLLSPLDGAGATAATISTLGSEWYAYRNGQYVKNPDSVAAYEGFWLKADKNGEAKVSVASTTPPTYPQGTGWKLYGTSTLTTSADVLAKNSAKVLYVYRDGAYKVFNATTNGVIPAGVGFWIK